MSKNYVKHGGAARRCFFSTYSRSLKQEGHFCPLPHQMQYAHEFNRLLSAIPDCNRLKDLSGVYAVNRHIKHKDGASQPALH